MKIDGLSFINDSRMTDAVVESGTTLPVANAQDNGRLFFLTQTQGANTPGLYLYNASSVSWAIVNDNTAVNAVNTDTLDNLDSLDFVRSTGFVNQIINGQKTLTGRLTSDLTVAGVNYRAYDTANNNRFDISVTTGSASSSGAYLNSTWNTGGTGNIHLQYASNTKLKIHSTGIDVTGTISASEPITVSSANDSMLRFNVPSGSANEWSYISWYGSDGARDSYFGINSAGFPIWAKDGGTIVTLSDTGISMTGNISVTGAVDGRDIAVDGSKLDTIASSANNYTHPNYSSTNQSLTNDNVVGSITTNATGHVTGMTNRQLLPEDLGGTRLVTGGGGWGSFLSVGGGGVSYNQSNKTGHIQIKLPVLWSSHMLQFHVDVFDYIADKLVSFHIAGYNYAGSLSWNRTSVHQTGGISDIPVYFGDDGVNACIWIGSPAYVWQYPKVIIRDVLVGFTTVTNATWKDGWSVTVNTTPRITTNVTHSNPQGFGPRKTDTSAFAGPVTTVGKLTVGTELSSPVMYTGTSSSSNGYFYSDIPGRTSFRNGDFYIQNTVINSFNYATNQYVGNVSGSTIRFRGNTLTADNWGINTSGVATFAGAIVGDTINAGDVAATGGGVGLQIKYNGADILNSFGASYSTGDTFIGRGLRSSTTTAATYTSTTATNATRGLVEVSDKIIFRNAPISNATVGSVVSTTERFRIDASGNLTLTGTVDGRNVSADGSKLDTIASNANNYTHPNYSATNINTSGATVVDIITTNSTGHVTTLGTRTLTAANIGAATSGHTHTTITPVDESVDTICYPAFFNTATGNQAIKTGTNLTFNASSGQLTATILNSSDRALKKNITDYVGYTTSGIQAKLYEFKDSSKGGPGIKVGYIADEVELVLPEAVSGTPGNQAVDYTMVHTTKIAELERLVERQQQQIDNLIKVLNDSIN